MRHRCSSTLADDNATVAALTAGEVGDEPLLEVVVVAGVGVAEQNAARWRLADATRQVHRLVDHPLDQVAVAVQRVVRQVTARAQNSNIS